jgi:5-carboxymethyl-2-hydroxymuconate isomerase
VNSCRLLFGSENSELLEVLARKLAEHVEAKVVVVSIGFRHLSPEVMSKVVEATKEKLAKKC